MGLEEDLAPGREKHRRARLSADKAVTLAPVSTADPAVRPSERAQRTMSPKRYEEHRQEQERARAAARFNFNKPGEY